MHLNSFFGMPVLSPLPRHGSGALLSDRALSKSIRPLLIGRKLAGAEKFEARATVPPRWASEFKMGRRIGRPGPWICRVVFMYARGYDCGDLTSEKDSMNTNSLNTANYRRQRVLTRALVAAGLWISILANLCPARAQTATVPARVTEEVDTTRLVTLRGNTHPLARPEYDRGPAPEGMPMERILLVLKRSPEQEATLRQLLDAQQTK